MLVYQRVPSKKRMLQDMAFPMENAGVFAHFTGKILGIWDLRSTWGFSP